MITAADEDNGLLKAVRFGSAELEGIVCPQCRMSGKVHQLKNDTYECSNINRCRTVKVSAGCRFTSTLHSRKVQGNPICPRCGGGNEIVNLGGGNYACGSESCRSLRPTGGYKFTPTSQTLLHGASNIDAYLKTAELIFNRTLAPNFVALRSVSLDEIKLVCGLTSRSTADRIRADIYQAMQPPVLKQCTETTERCGLGRYDCSIKYRGIQTGVKIFILCDMKAVEFGFTKHGRRRPTAFYPSRIRVTFYNDSDDHKFVFKTHFLPIFANETSLKKFIPPFIFFCPDKSKFNFTDGRIMDSTGFDNSSFKHRLERSYLEFKAMEKCVNEEEKKIKNLMATFSRPYKELGHFLCEYVFKRNIELKQEPKSVSHLIKGLLTPMLPEGLQIRKDLAPGRGFPKG